MLRTMTGLSTMVSDLPMPRGAQTPNTHLVRVAVMGLLATLTSNPVHSTGKTTLQCTSSASDVPRSSSDNA
jgi:hypothetical protein